MMVSGGSALWNHALDIVGAVKTVSGKKGGLNRAANGSAAERVYGDFFSVMLRWHFLRASPPASLVDAFERVRAFEKPISTCAGKSKPCRLPGSGGRTPSFPLRAEAVRPRVKEHKK